ncbi:hypothetical protein, partial [Burkholderia multivorans]|uniref:hypothetical protein n=1 Tax=Burkholderia multivorans TaxID=87883 RepID=UPI001E60ACE0
RACCSRSSGCAGVRRGARWRNAEEAKGAKGAKGAKEAKDAKDAKDAGDERVRTRALRAARMPIAYSELQPA